MFTFYYVDKLPQHNGTHGVHIKGCHQLPADAQRLFLGSFFSARDALQTARLRLHSVAHCQSCLTRPGKEGKLRRQKSHAIAPRPAR